MLALLFTMFVPAASEEGVTFDTTLTLTERTQDASWLPYVSSIDGDLIIAANVSRVDLSSLKTVSGSLYVQSDMLASLLLSRLESIGNQVSVHSLTTLLQISLPRLQSIGGALFVSHNAELVRLSMPRLASVVGPVSIHDNGKGLPSADRAMAPAWSSGARFNLYDDEHRTTVALLSGALLCLGLLCYALRLSVLRAVCSSCWRRRCVRRRGGAQGEGADAPLAGEDGADPVPMRVVKVSLGPMPGGSRAGDEGAGGQEDEPPTYRQLEE